MNLFNYSHHELQKKVIDKEDWGSYLIVDNFLGSDLFDLLVSDLDRIKEAKKDIFSDEESVRAWDKKIPKGKHYIIGGKGTEIDRFNKADDSADRRHELLVEEIDQLKEQVSQLREKISFLQGRINGKSVQ